MTTLIVLRNFEDGAGRPDLGRVVMRQRGEHIAEKDEHRKMWHRNFEDFLIRNGYVRVEGAPPAEEPPKVVLPAWGYGLR